MPHPVMDAALQFRAQALARERATATTLVRAYGQVYRDLDPAIRALEEAVAGLETPRPADIQRLGALRTLRSQVAEQVNRYAIYADQTIAQQIQPNILAGLNDSQALVAAHFDRAWLEANGLRLNTDVQAAIRAAWVRVPTEAVESMLGMVGPDSPLRRTLVDRLGAVVAERTADALVSGIARGLNPRTLVREAAGQGLTISLTTARTAQLNAYRYATAANYQANRDIVSGWRWLAQLGPRTCVSCLAQHGTLHSVDEVLNDHHNGRCLLPGQVVTTQRGAVAIEAVQVGDFVLTHNGRWRAVTATSQRPYSGAVYRFSQDGRTLTVTPEHPMLTYRGWVPASACSASDTLWTLNDVEARVSSLSTTQPSAASFASLTESRCVRDLVMCQRGSSSTASMASGNAISMLYEPTANCGTGANPLARNAPRNSSSRGVQNVSQSRCLVWARDKARRRWASGAFIRANVSGSRSIWRTAAVLGEIGSSPASRIQRMTVRVLTPVSAHSSRYEACSSTYLRRNQVAIGSPRRSATPTSNLAVSNTPTSAGEVRKPRAEALCKTALCVRPGSDRAMSLSNTEPNDSMMMRSSSGVHALPAITPPLAIGHIIHRPLHIAQMAHTGMVYNLQVDEDESYVANGIVVHNCTSVPVVPLAQRLGLPEPEIGDAEAYLRGLPEAQQKAQMGAGLWEEWNAGRVQLGDLTSTYEDAVWGTMRRAPTLEQVRAYATA